MDSPQIACLHLETEDFALQEARFNLLKRTNPELADRLFTLAQRDIDERLAYYNQLANVTRHVNA